MKKNTRVEVKMPLPEIQQVLSPEDLVLKQMVTNDGGEWPQIEAGHDFSLNNDPFRFPDICYTMEAEKRWKFRWVSSERGELDRRRNRSYPYTWKICNSLNTPFLKGHFDSCTGGVKRDDCILMFKPWEWHMAERNIVDTMSGGKSTIPTDNVVLTGERGATPSIEAGAKAALGTGRETEVYNEVGIDGTGIGSNDLEVD